MSAFGNQFIAVAKVTPVLIPSGPCEPSRPIPTPRDLLGSHCCSLIAQFGSIDRPGMRLRTINLT